ncbi:MAG: hypothetical protein ABSF60_00860 [Verrucomicrobiota bacterium]
MKKILILLLFSLVLPRMAMAGDDNARLSNTNSDNRGDKSGAPTEVIIIGGLHERHRDNTNYSTKALTEIIVGLKPTAILIELPPTIGGKPTIKEHRIVFSSPECNAANAAAETLKVPIICFDRPGRNEFYKETHYFDRQKRADEALEVWGRTLAETNPESVDLQVAQVLFDAGGAQEWFSHWADARIINSEGFDRIIHTKHNIWEHTMPKLLNKYPGQQQLIEDLEFHGKVWTERNQIMAENISAIAKQFGGRRLAVVTGCEHRYILRDLLANQPEIVLKEFWEVSPPDFTMAENNDAYLACWVKNHGRTADEYFLCLFGRQSTETK